MQAWFPMGEPVCGQVLPAKPRTHWLFQVGAGLHFPCVEQFPIMNHLGYHFSKAKSVPKVSLKIQWEVLIKNHHVSCCQSTYKVSEAIGFSYLLYFESQNTTWGYHIAWNDSWAMMVLCYVPKRIGTNEAQKFNTNLVTLLGVLEFSSVGRINKFFIFKIAFK